MKFLISVSTLMILGNFVASAQALKTSADSLNYAIGLVTAEDLKKRLKDWDGLNKDLATSGFEHNLAGKTPLMSVEDGRKMIRKLEKELHQKAAAANKAAGENFLKENAKRKEVMTTSSGLQYEVITKGTGTVKPLITDYVKVHYHGTLIDGKVFDSSVEKGKPADFAIAKVVPGFAEALQLMHVGDKFKVFVPQELGYAERGTPPQQGGNIKPYSALIFELELLEILDPSKMPPAKPRPAPQLAPAQGMPKN